MAYIYYGDPGLYGLGAVTTTDPGQLTEIVRARAHAVRSAATDAAFFQAHNSLFEAIAAALNVEASGRPSGVTSTSWEAFQTALRRAQYTAENEVPPSTRPAGRPVTEENGEGEGLMRYALPAAGLMGVVALALYLGGRRS